MVFASDGTPGSTRMRLAQFDRRRFEGDPEDHPLLGTDPYTTATTLEAEPRFQDTEQQQWDRL